MQVVTCTEFSRQHILHALRLQLFTLCSCEGRDQSRLLPNWVQICLYVYIYGYVECINRKRPRHCSGTLRYLLFSFWSMFRTCFTNMLRVMNYCSQHHVRYVVCLVAGRLSSFRLQYKFILFSCMRCDIHVAYCLCFIQKYLERPFKHTTKLTSI